MRRILAAWRGLLGTAAPQGGSPDTQPQPLDTQPPYADGGQIAHYRFEREIARGAMGTVYAARDPATGGKLALKVVDLPYNADADELDAHRERFLREAEAARRLQHPDITAVFDAGDDGRRAWLAMELVSGRDLGTYTVTGELLSVSQVVQIGARVARALAFAHRQGVVHRDIKPANVMVDPDRGVVKISDFGIAHLIDTARTRTGLVLGTPSYMAPEQMAGRRIDGRADLYSLGAMLFQLLTGRLPFEAPTMGGLLAAVAQEPAPDIRSLRPELPEALAQVVALAMEKRPELRYANGDQMAHDLEEIAVQIASPDR
jgi:serine/threonine protein kinase